MLWFWLTLGMISGYDFRSYELMRKVNRQYKWWYMFIPGYNIYQEILFKRNLKKK